MVGVNQYNGQGNRLNYKLLSALVVCALALFAQNDLVAGRDAVSEVIEVKSVTEGLLSFEDIDLLSSEPVTESVIELNSIVSSSIRISYTITPIYYSVEEAAALVQGVGMALTFVWQEDEGRFFVSAFDASVGEGGGWLYGTIPDYRGGSAEILLELKGGQYSVWVEGVLMLQDLTASVAESDEIVFYGDASHDISIKQLTVSEIIDNDAAKRSADTIEQRYGRARRLGDVSLTDGGKLIHRGSLLTRKGDAFRSKMASIPEELRDLDLSKVIFVDNEIGDDQNSGRWPEANGRNGPKESLKAAIEAAPDGGAVVLMPGYGVYVEEGIEIPRKRCSLVVVGDNAIGPEKALLQAYEKGEVSRPNEFMNNYQQAVMRQKRIK